MYFVLAQRAEERLMVHARGAYVAIYRIKNDEVSIVTKLHGIRGIKLHKAMCH